MLNNRGDNGHPCFTPDFIGNASNLFPLQMMLVEGLGKALLFLYSLVFSIGMGVLFYQRLFLHLLIWACGFFSLLIDMVDYVDGFPNIEPSLHSWYKAHLIIMNEPPDH